MKADLGCLSAFPPSLALLPTPTGPPLESPKQNALKKRVYKLPRGAPDDGAARVTVSISRKKTLDISFQEKLKKPILQRRDRLVK